MTKWRGILKILEIQLIENNKIIFEKRNLKNLMHLQGEEYFLNVLFSGSSIPTYYYFGLDNRENLDVLDTLDDLYQEPSRYGYSRQSVDSSSGWTFSTSGSIYRAVSPIITFTASGGSIGPIQNVFLTTQDSGESTVDGYLISSIYLESSITILDGNSISLRASVGLGE